jgi:hypothetical protein
MLLALSALLLDDRTAVSVMVAITIASVSKMGEIQEIAPMLLLLLPLPSDTPK